MQTREWLLTAAVIVVPLIVAVVVTLWSLDQVRYRPKQRRSTDVARETSVAATREAANAGVGQGLASGESDVGSRARDGRNAGDAGNER